MRFSRLLDSKCVSRQRQGRLGTYPPATGQEAAIVGTALALDTDRDWIVPQYREAVALVRST
jgi:pyruvate dehydrogenase E1 component alpha subunit